MSLFMIEEEPEWGEDEEENPESEFGDEEEGILIFSVSVFE